MALKDLRTIEDSEVSDKRIHQLRVRPNQRSIYGAPGLTGKELQAKYDEYAELLRQHFNELVEAIVESLKNDDGNGSKLAEEIMVIVSEPDSLPIYTDNLKNAIQEMIGDIKTASYTANGAENIADEAKETAIEAKNTADEAKETANGVKNIADEAKETAENAVEAVDAAQSTAEEALSIAKGINRAETFDNVEQMNAWIEERKEEVEADSVTGKTFSAGTTLIYSVDDKPEGHLIDGASLSAIVSLNNDESFTSAFVQQGRAYCLVHLTEETYIESFEAQILYSNGTDSIYCSENPRLTYVEGSVDNYSGIYYDLIKSHNIAVGTNLYIRDVGVPAYWWDGSKAQQLETKVDLSDYAKEEVVKEGLQLILDAVNDLSAQPGYITVSSVEELNNTTAEDGTLAIIEG